uniref:DUF3527 domain protein n=1 Tax=Quercus lobata TaxID=97700 RepID=A0A7N2M4D2_QUELO
MLRSSSGIREARKEKGSAQPRWSKKLGRLRLKSNNSSKSIPQLSSSYVSVKSGPVRSETSAYSDTSNREKSNGHNRVKSSPLRRLLDPILKYKVSNSFHSAETILPSKESLDSFCSRPTSGSDTLQNEKHEASTTQAFLQLTVKNGLPLFSFAVKNDKMIFAATMKNLTSSGKDDSDRYYKLYFVNEIKKKSGGWIIQGSKRPSHGCDYYVVGQMKVSSSSNNQFLVRESVLSEDRCSCNYKETEDSDSIVVILPGGAHGLPSKGEPSRLMDRWKSGGSCDCEGWDVGCKLCVLSNQNQSTKIPKISKDCPIPDHIELFLQGGSQQASPFFSLTELKDGLYSIEFNSSISLLQSFFICVAVLSCKRPFNLLDMSEAKVFKEPILNENDGSQRRASSKYAPNPSSSPVGRV